MRPTQKPITYEEASIDVAADPAAVYALVSDITRMGEWSPETIGGRWLDGGSGEVGDRFEGHNRSGEREWSRQCEVVTADEGLDFTFVVGGLENSYTWWSYEMEPSSTGTTLTERWWIANKSPAMAEATDDQLAARVAFTKEMLRSTIDAVKRTAEGRS